MKLTKFDIQILEESIKRIISQRIDKSYKNWICEGKGEHKKAYRNLSVFLDDPEDFKDWIKNDPPNNSIYICVRKIKNH